MAGTLRHSDAVFMYSAKDRQTYTDYEATAVAWGSDHTREAVQETLARGVRPCGNLWLLPTDGKALHQDPDLFEASVMDIAGEKIRPSWLWDLNYEGTPFTFGCTNNPTFRAHVRSQVCRAMAGGALTLQVDLPDGTANCVQRGGCFCDYCMKDFAAYLQGHSTPELLAEAGVATFDGFNYRDLARQYATTREEYLEVRERIPLQRTFHDCQLQLAIENLRALRALAEDIAKQPIALTANTNMPSLEYATLVPYLDYVVCEMTHSPQKGTADLLGPVRSYRMVEALGKPTASTAQGWEWAYVKVHQCENLVKLWIALSYACGHCLMVPNYKWCYTPELGTHWYDGPTEAYAPLYRFVRQHSELFDGLETIGPLQTPSGIPTNLETWAGRQAFQEAMDHGGPHPLQAGEHVWVFPRTGAGGAVAHLLNLDYRAGQDQLVPQRNVTIRLDPNLYGHMFSRATLYAYDTEPVELEVRATPSEMILTVPELRLWSIVRF